ncbi:MAG: hypothetical protein ABSF62_10950 [Bryobacteraceae bacterium]
MANSESTASDLVKGYRLPVSKLRVARPRQDLHELFVRAWAFASPHFIAAA